MSCCERSSQHFARSTQTQLRADNGSRDTNTQMFGDPMMAHKRPSLSSLYRGTPLVARGTLGLPFTQRFELERARQSFLSSPGTESAILIGFALRRRFELTFPIKCAADRSLRRSTRSLGGRNATETKTEETDLSSQKPRFAKKKEVLA